MHDVHAAEVGAAEDAVAATLGMLPPLMSVFAEVAKEKNSPSPLEPGPLTHALLVEGPGGSSPLAAAVASYAAYPFDATFRPLALPALAALCAAAPVDPPLACALPSLAPASGAHSAFALPYNDTDVGKKGEGDAKLDVRAAIVNALKPHAARGDPDGFRAAAALVTAAAVRQPVACDAQRGEAELRRHILLAWRREQIASAIFANQPALSVKRAARSHKIVSAAATRLALREVNPQQNSGWEGGVPPAPLQPLQLSKTRPPRSPRLFPFAPPWTTCSTPRRSAPTPRR